MGRCAAIAERPHSDWSRSIHRGFHLSPGTKHSSIRVEALIREGSIREAACSYASRPHMSLIGETLSVTTIVPMARISPKRCGKLLPNKMLDTLIYHL